MSKTFHDLSDPEEPFFNPPDPINGPWPPSVTI